MSELFVTFDHLHSVPGFSPRAGFCHKGARRLAEHLGLDWAEMVRKGGVDAATLEATGDAMALRLVEHAKSMEAQRG